MALSASSSGSFGPTQPLPTEVWTKIFGYLQCGEILACSEVSVIFKKVAEQDVLWNKFLQPSSILNKEIKKTYVDLRKRAVFRACVTSSAPIEKAFGGAEAITKSPFLDLQGLRSPNNGCVRLEEVDAPLTIGRFFITYKTENETRRSSHYFFAFRFVKRAPDFHEESRHLNIWCKNVLSRFQWTVWTGSPEDNQPILFHARDGIDFPKTAEYISRLVQGKPCWVLQNMTPIEEDHLIAKGKSMIELV
jgi:hypothetical protein